MKLMGFYYKVVYKQGRENVAADALSLRNEDMGECCPMVVSQPQFTFVDRLKVELLVDPVLSMLISYLLLSWILIIYIYGEMLN